MWGGAGIALGQLSDGTVWTWGWANYGCLGNGYATTMFDTNRQYDSWVPIQPLGAGGIGTLAGIVQISGGERHQVALDSGGNFWTWGWNAFGQLGLGTYPASQDPHYLGLDSMSAVPVRITNGFSAVKAIGTRAYHTVALKTNGEVWAWGMNSHGQLGDNSNTDRHSPVQVSGLTGHGAVLDISGGGYMSAALMADHTLMIWGRNNQGQLGNGTTDDSDIGQWTPVAVSQATGLTNIEAVSLGWMHVVALASDGTVWTWGDSPGGEPGNGGSTITNLPVRVPGLTNIVQVSAGDGYTTALKADGMVWSWGANWGAGLGDGTTNSHSSPVQVAVGHTFRFVRARNWQTYAVETDGTAWAWGQNQYGQLGDGTYGTNRLSPIGSPGQFFALPARVMARCHQTVTRWSAGVRPTSSL